MVEPQAQGRRQPLAPEVCLQKLEESVSNYPVETVVEALARFLENPTNDTHKGVRRAMGIAWHPDRLEEGTGPAFQDLTTWLNDLINPDSKELIEISADPIAAERVRNTIRVAEAIGNVQVITTPLNRNLNSNEIIAFGVGSQTPTSFEISVDGKAIQFRVADGVLQSNQLNQMIGSMNVEIIETNGGKRLLVLHNRGRDPKNINFKLSDTETAVTSPIEIPGGGLGVPVSRMGSTKAIPVGGVGGGDDRDERSGSTVEIDPTATRRERPLGKDKSKEPVEKPFSEIFPTHGKLVDLSKKESASTKSGFIARLSSTIGFGAPETALDLTVHNGEVGGVLFDTGSFSRNITLTLGRESLAININNGIVSINSAPLGQGNFRRFGNLEMGLRVIPPPPNAGSGKSVLMIRHSKESQNKNPITVS